MHEENDGKTPHRDENMTLRCERQTRDARRTQKLNHFKLNDLKVEKNDAKVKKFNQKLNQKPKNTVIVNHNTNNFIQTAKSSIKV